MGTPSGSSTTPMASVDKRLLWGWVYRVSSSLSHSLSPGRLSVNGLSDMAGDAGSLCTFFLSWTGSSSKSLSGTCDDPQVESTVAKRGWPELTGSRIRYAMNVEQAAATNTALKPALYESCAARRRAGSSPPTNVADFRIFVMSYPDEVSNNCGKV